MYQHTSSLKNSFESPSVSNFEKFIDEKMIEYQQISLKRIYSKILIDLLSKLIQLKKEGISLE